MPFKIISFSMFTLLFWILSCENGDVPTEPKEPDEPGDTNIMYKIAFVSNRDMEYRYQLYTMYSDGSKQTRLTNDSINYVHPRFSPDGTKIVFCSRMYDTNDEIYIINSDGSNYKNLTKTAGNNNFPQFSPDGSKIVFTSDRDGNREIYIMDVDGSNQLRLTNNLSLDHAPQFSPNGSRILFYSIADDWTYNIYTIDPDGGNRTNLTEIPYAHLAIKIDKQFDTNYWFSPQYSPDGSKIVFVSFTSSPLNNNIFIMNSDGSDQTQLTDTLGYDINPRFTPDGSQIVFMTHRGRNYDIYTMDLEGKNQFPLYDSNYGHAVFSQFSPDGSKILFMDDIIVLKQYKIYIMDSDGGNPTMLTSGSYQDYFPQFQP